MSPFESFWPVLGCFGSYCVVGVSKSLFGSFGLLWVILGEFRSPFGLFWLVLGRFRSIYVFLWVVLTCFRSFWLVLGRFGSV